MPFILVDRLQNGSPYMLLDRCLSVLSVCNFGVLWPNGWTEQDETWHAGRPRPWPLPQKGTAPQFSAHICCGDNRLRFDKVIDIVHCHVFMEHNVYSSLRHFCGEPSAVSSKLSGKMK